MGGLIDDLRSVYGPTGGEDEVPERGTVLDHFVVIERIGEGAMGVVLAAYDTKLDTQGGDQDASPRSKTDPEDPPLVTRSPAWVLARPR